MLESGGHAQPSIGLLVEQSRDQIDAGLGMAGRCDQVVIWLGIEKFFVDLSHFTSIVCGVLRAAFRLEWELLRQDKEEDHTKRPGIGLCIVGPTCDYLRCSEPDVAMQVNCGGIWTQDLGILEI